MFTVHVFSISQEVPIYPPLLVANTCSLLSAIISELSASATGTEVRHGQGLFAL